MRRYRQRERRTRTGLTPQPDGAVVIGRDVLDDGQSQSGAAGGPRPRRVDAEESLEHPLLIVAGDADASIGHRDLDVVAASAATDRDGRTLGRVCNCV